MNLQEFEAITRTSSAAAHISSADLVNKAPRTLIYGFTCDRDTFHVYLDSQGEIHRVVYGYPDRLLQHSGGESIDPVLCVPNKRVYPEACDFEFCNLLKAHDISIPFTTFDDRRDLSAAFHGLVEAQLKRS